MESPYLPPSSPAAPDSDRAKKRRFWKRMIWGTVTGMLLVPALGFAGTVVGMVRAFGELSEKGSADPEALASSISASLLSAFFGLLFWIPGIIILILSIVRFRACAPVAENDPSSRP